MKKKFIIILTTLMLFCIAGVSFADVNRGTGDIVFMAFDGKTYDPWTTTGSAFGPGPRTLPTPVHMGAGMVSSSVGGDGSAGTLTSPSFTINKKVINFLIGAGNHPNQTCINLIIDNQVVCTTTGDNTPNLKWKNWDVSDLIGKTAQIQIVDNYAGPDWGHIDIDQIVFSDIEFQGQPGADAASTQEQVGADTASTQGTLKVRGDVELRYYHVKNDGEYVKDESQNILADIFTDLKINDSWTISTQSEINYNYGNQLRYDGSPGNDDLMERLWMHGKIAAADVTLGKQFFSPGMGLAFCNETTGAWVNFGKSIHTDLFIGDAPDERDSGKGSGTIFGLHSWKQFGPKTSVDVIVGGNHQTFNQSQNFTKYYKATTWSEIDFKRKFGDNWYTAAGYALSNADEFNTSYRIDITYKQMDLRVPGTWDAFFKFGKWGRNTAFGATNANAGNGGGSYGYEGGGYDDWNQTFGGDIDWQYTSYNTTYALGFEYVIMKNINTRVLYSIQNRDLSEIAPSSDTEKRNTFFLFLNFNFW